MDINTIAQLASERKKPTKADVFGILKKLKFNEDTVASLYAFFCDYETSGKNLSDFAWVKKAHEKDIRFPYLQVVAGTLLGTNGKIMHCVETDLEDGWYDFAGAKLNVDRRTLTERQLKKVNAYYEGSVPLVTLKDVRIVSNAEVYVLNENHGILVSQYKKVLTGLKNPVLAYNESVGCVLLKEGKRTALIMCWKLKD